MYEKKKSAVLVLIVLVVIAVLWAIHDARHPTHEPAPNTAISSRDSVTEIPIVQESKSIPESSTPDTPSSANADTEADAVLPEKATNCTLSGVVMNIDDDQPVPDAQVTFAGYRRGKRYELMTDAVGRFDSGEMEPDKYRGKVSHPILVLLEPGFKYELVAGEKRSGTILEMTRGASISGRLYDGDTGEGLANVQVVAGTADEGPGGWMGPRTTTDTDGRYVFRAIEAGTYQMMRDDRRILHGYPQPGSRIGQQETRTVSVLFGEILDHIDIVVRRGVCISGVVYDSSGNTLEGAHIQATPNPRGFGYANGFTDEQGAFILAGVELDKRYGLTAHKKGFASAKLTDLQLGTEGLQGVEVILYPEARAEGILTTPDGTPLYRATVTFKGVEGEAYRGSSDTDEEGRFVVTGLSPGGYEVSAWQPRSSSRNPTVLEGAPPILRVKKGEHIKGLRLVLREVEPVGFTISGLVTDTAGQPVDKAEVHLRGEFAEKAYGLARTDGNGEYTAYLKRAGTYKMDVVKWTYTQQTRHGVETGSVGVDFMLRGTGAVELRVVDAPTRQPIPRFRFSYTYDLPFAIGFNGGNWREDPEGRVMLENIKERPMGVWVAADGYRAAEQVVKGVTEGQTLSGVEIALHPGGELECTVYNPAGEILDDARVYVSRLDQSVDPGRRQLGSTAESRFPAKHLPDEPLIIRAEHDHYAAAWTVIEPAEALIRVELMLTPGGVLEGVVAIDGTPAPNRELSIEYLDESAAKYAARTDENGVYQHDLLPEGPVLVSVVIPDDTSQVSGEQQTANVQAGVVITVDFDVATQ
jgi:protocatechuate 3,4-dioxygenase beta subunit